MDLDVDAVSMPFTPKIGDHHGQNTAWPLHPKLGSGISLGNSCGNDANNHYWVGIFSDLGILEFVAGFE
ncbi:MAG: hypothetical protein AAF215_03145 [Cyanobacteria bacterium P01_A01_bin.123]